MKRFLSIYKTCITIAIARSLTYRLNFVLSMLISLGFNVFSPLAAILIYRAGASFPDWNIYEVLLIQSVFLLSNGLAHIMFSGVFWTTIQHSREGSFEIVLLRPLNPLFFLIVSNFDPESFGLIIGGGVLFAFSIAHTGIASLTAVAQFLLLFAGGFAVMAGMQMLMAATVFKWVGNSRIPEIFESIMNFGRYPVMIFPKAIRSIITFVIPVGMIGFFPASALLGQFEPAALIAVAPCILFMLFGIWLYQYMVRLYEGVGG